MREKEEKTFFDEILNCIQDYKMKVVEILKNQREKIRDMFGKEKLSFEKNAENFKRIFNEISAFKKHISKKDSSIFNSISRLI